MAKKSTKIDWDAFDDEVSKAGKSAAEKTDDALSQKLAAITSLTQKEVLEIFPEQTDLEKFAKLMKIVKSGSQKNQKQRKIIANAEEFSGIILSLLSKIV